MSSEKITGRVLVSQEGWDKIRNIIGGIPDDVDEIIIENQELKMARRPKPEPQIRSNSDGSGPKMRAF